MSNNDPVKCEEELGGLRYDDGKTRYDLIPFDALHAVAEVYTQGAVKYAPRNWEKGMLYSRCLGSLMRHVAAWQNGEDVDAESGSHHMAHAAWNALALLTYNLRGTGSDDRPKSRQPLSRRELIDKLLAEEFQVSASGIGESERNRLELFMGRTLKKADTHLAELDKRWKENAPLPAIAGIIHGDGRRVSLDDIVSGQNSKSAQSIIHKCEELKLPPGTVMHMPEREYLPAHKAIELKIGTKVKLHGDQEQTWTIRADLGNGKFDVQSDFNQFKQMIHLRAITDVVEEVGDLD